MRVLLACAVLATTPACAVGPGFVLPRWSAGEPAGVTLDQCTIVVGRRAAELLRDCGAPACRRADAWVYPAARVGRVGSTYTVVGFAADGRSRDARACDRDCCAESVAAR